MYRSWNFVDEDFQNVGLDSWLHQRPTTLDGLHVSSGVCTALRNRSCGASVDNHRWDRGGGISFSDGDLLRLAGLLATVRTKALPFQHRGTSAVEPMGNADVWLTLHEGSLSRKTKEELLKWLPATFTSSRKTPPPTDTHWRSKENYRKASRLTFSLRQLPFGDKIIVFCV